MSELRSEPEQPEAGPVTNETFIDTEAASIDLANRVCTIASERFGHSSRVIHERDGDNIQETLMLSPDLDPGLFIDELKGFGSLEVTCEYALSGKPEDLAEQVTFKYARGNVVQEVVFLRDEAPVIEQFMVIGDESTKKQTVEPSVEWLFDMNDATKAVEAALDEEAQLLRPKRPRHAE